MQITVTARRFHSGGRQLGRETLVITTAIRRRRATASSSDVRPAAAALLRTRRYLNELMYTVQYRIVQHKSISSATVRMRARYTIIC